MSGEPYHFCATCGFIRSGITLVSPHPFVARFDVCGHPVPGQSGFVAESTRSDAPDRRTT